MPGRRPDSTEKRAPLEVRLGPAARRQYDSLPRREREAIRAALIALSATTASGGRGSKTLKTIRGTEGDFHRVRVGDWRIMYDVLSDDKVLLVLGIVNRRDLERWLRNR